MFLFLTHLQLFAPWAVETWTHRFNSRIHSYNKASFSFFLSHAHVFNLGPRPPHRCRERLNLVFAVCWQRSTSKNKHRVNPSWQTGIEMSCHSTNSCDPLNHKHHGRSSRAAARSALMSCKSNMAKTQAGTWTTPGLYVLTHAHTGMHTLPVDGSMWQLQEGCPNTAMQQTFTDSSEKQSGCVYLE